VAFAVIYRWSVEPGQEDAFARRWREGTERLRTLGGLGSCLCRDEGGAFVAFARWPDEAAREAAFAAAGPGEPWPGVTDFSETRLRVVDDRLAGAAE
jgi:heme-degrading monooxygenase HmoA